MTELYLRPGMILRALVPLSPVPGSKWMSFVAENEQELADHSASALAGTCCTISIQGQSPSESSASSGILGALATAGRPGIYG